MAGARASADGEVLALGYGDDGVEGVDLVVFKRDLVVEHNHPTNRKDKDALWEKVWENPTIRCDSFRGEVD